MVKVLFVCHGNICRSPMAEFLFKNMVNDKYYIKSFATSYEEIGNPVHYGTVKILNGLGIDCSKKRAEKLRKEMYDDYDMFIGMDEYNMINMQRIFGKKEKLFKLMNFAGLCKDVADPWYTGNFTQTYEDIMLGLNGLIKYLER